MLLWVAKQVKDSPIIRQGDSNQPFRVFPDPDRELWGDTEEGKAVRLLDSFSSTVLSKYSWQVSLKCRGTV